MQGAAESRAGARKSSANKKAAGKPGDVSASSSAPGPATRTQSSDSSSDPKGPGATKRNSSKRGAKARVSVTSERELRMLVARRLNDFRQRNGKFNGIIRIIADADFLKGCYSLIKGNPGNMTPGSTKVTLDGITDGFFEKTAKDLLTGSFKFSPSRRVMIPKPGKQDLRPLSVGSPREKVVQKALQLLLEGIFEPTFLDCSYGFRPGRSLFGALLRLHLVGAKFTWVIQGDISKCFDRISHSSLTDCLRDKISCDRTLSLISNHIRVGYIDPDTGRQVKQQFGTPQGSVLSPLLANIVLHRLDVFVESELKPQYTQGTSHRANPLYQKLIRSIRLAPTLAERRSFRNALR